MSCKDFSDHKSKDFFHMKGNRNKRCQIPIQQQQTMEKNDWDNKWLIDYNVRFLIYHFSDWSKRWVIPVQNTWTVKLVLDNSIGDLRLIKRWVVIMKGFLTSYSRYLLLFCHTISLKLWYQIDQFIYIKATEIDLIIFISKGMII